MFFLCLKNLCNVEFFLRMKLLSRIMEVTTETTVCFLVSLDQNNRSYSNNWRMDNYLYFCYIWVMSVLHFLCPGRKMITLTTFRTVIVSKQ